MYLLRVYLVFFILSISVCWAESEQGGRKVTIDDLVTMVLQNNAELKSFEAEVMVAKGTRTQAGLFKNPNVSFEFGGRQVKDSAKILQGNGSTMSISVMQTFQFPGKGTLRKAIANKNIEIAELGLKQFRLALAAQVQLLAYEYIAAVAESNAAESVYKQIQEIVSNLNSHLEYGARLQIEIRLIQASLAELATAIKETSLRREETRTQLNALLGNPQNLPLHISASLMSLPKKPLNATNLVFAAQSSNPLLKIRQREIERAARELTASRLDIAPDFVIGPFFSRDIAGDREQNIGGAISVTIPIWDWNIGNIQSAKARFSAAQALRVKAERDIEAQILSRLKAYELTRRQLEMIPAGLLKNIQEASTLADSQFRNGSIGAQLYLATQSAYLNSIKLSQKGILDAWRAFLDLKLLTGGQFNHTEEG